MSTERKAAQRDRDKALGFVRLELRIEAQELTELDELCQLLRPGKEPYTRPELFGLLVRRARQQYKDTLAKISHCRKCGDAAPVNECVCAGDSECWRTYGPGELVVKVK